MEKENMSGQWRKILQIGMHSAMVEGEQVDSIPTLIIFVEDKNERNTLKNVSPGQFAITYDLSHTWCKNGNMSVPLSSDDAWDEVV